MTVKNDNWFLHNEYVTTPFNKEHVNPTSIDVCWSGRVREPNRVSPWFQGETIFDASGHPHFVRLVDTLNKPNDLWESVKEVDILKLEPYHLTGRVYLLDTLEQIQIPLDKTCNFQLKSSIGRLFLEQLHAGWGDAGFGLGDPSTYTLEVVNLSPWLLIIHKGQRIGQLVINDADSPDNGYNTVGHYHGQKEPTP